MYRIAENFKTGTGLFNIISIMGNKLFRWTYFSRFTRKIVKHTKNHRYRYYPSTVVDTPMS